jgi:hypothetical protein
MQMASSPNTKSSLDTMFKYKVAKKVNQLYPTHSIVQKLIPELSEAEKTGRKYLCPVALTLENGVTYGDGTVFAYNDDVAGVYDEIELDSNPIVLKSRVSMAAANRMANKESSFITSMSLRAGNMKDSLMKRYELECIYGKTGLGTISGNPSVNTTPTPDQATIIFTDASWAPGIWGGMEGCLLECRNGSTLVNANGDLTLVSVDVDNKTIVVSGDNTDLTDLADGYKIFFKGAYANSFHGIDYQLTNTGSLFGIDAATYNLWKGNSYAVGGQLTMSKVLKGVAKAVGKGGLAEDAVLLVSALTYEGLNSDMAGLREFDSSYKKEEGVNGVKGIVYYAQSGRIKIVAHPFVKEGEAFLVPEKGMKRVGASEIQFGFGDGEYFEKLEGNAGFQLLAQGDWCLLIEKPARCVKYTGITNAA